MGLDIHLYRYTADPAAVRASEQAYEQFSERAWEEVAPGKKYDEMTQAEKDAASARVRAYAAEHGLGEWGEHTGRVEIVRDSVKYPEHLCKRGYLRSSYNAGGFNHVTSDLLGVDGFYHIFEAALSEADEDRYEILPSHGALEDAKARALVMAARLREVPPYRVATISHNPFTGLATTTAESAIKSFLDQRAKREKQVAEWQEKNPGKTPSENDVWTGWSNRDGSYWFDGLTVAAAIPGTDSLGSPCVHLVYRDTEQMEWYARAAEIAAEFCDEALSLDAPCIHWSS